jgi:hypothetical protein
VTLPASQLNIAICGGTGDGKSYLAGLILEQLMRLGYSAIVFDPEGDHRGLGNLHGVFVTGGREDRLADPADVVRLLRNGYSSVVVVRHAGTVSHSEWAPGSAIGQDVNLCCGLDHWLRREIPSDSAMWSASMARRPSPRCSRACRSSLRELLEGPCGAARSGSAPCSSMR